MENLRQANEITQLRAKVEKDCALALHLVEMLEDADAAARRSKEQTKQLKKQLAKAEGLLQTTLNLKLHYEEVLVKLMADSSTKRAT